MGSTMADVRVRFAPSPTGYLHVGGARTAIFNWLYARAIGGKFLLRIEDTDPVRSRSELAQVILDGLKWLGIESDEPVVYQSDNKDRFVQVALELVKRGAAYYDFTTTEELEELRRQSQARKEPAFRFKSDRATMHASAQENLSAGKPYAVRFSADESALEWNDLVHGPIRFEGGELEDFVLLRSDGSPTYHLSVVCDDHDMNITHILRGDDHISNTPKQIGIYRAMGWEVPQFGHVPLILGADKQRLSKRAGATSVGEFQQSGFLSSAMFNFLTLLGWSPGAGDREIFLPRELVDVFTLAGIQARSAVFDLQKLEWMNGEHLRALSEVDAVNYLFEHRDGVEVSKQKLSELWPLVKPRIRLPRDLYLDQSYFFSDPIEYDSAGVEKHLKDPVIVGKLKQYAEQLSDVAFDAANLESNLRTRCEEGGVSAGKLIHPLRLALTGKTVSPGIFELMQVLGKDTVHRRLLSALRMMGVE